MSKELLNWYDEVKRDLPWRVDTDPYKVWLSEIMLQQTQVVTVISYFKRFIEKYPDVIALANADESDVFKLWEGLGYYSRAKNLLRCAKKVVDDYDGKFPSSAEALETLPGIGPYTAGAIASISFNQMVPAVDGNVLRVISRLECIDLPINHPKHMPLFKAHTVALMTERPGDFTQALMELGATICTPKNPKCDACPLSINCCALKRDAISLYPMKLPKLGKRDINLGILILVHEAEVLVVKNPNAGLLSNLWGFPILELDGNRSEETQIDGFLQETFGIVSKISFKREGKQHVFTHLKWKPILFFFYVNDKISIEFPQMDWSTLEGLKSKALATAFTKQLPLIQAGIEVLKNTNSEG